MAKKVWKQVDKYLGGLLVKPDAARESALAANKAAELPAIDVTPLQGQFLALLVRMTGAMKILEIGTLGGYSALWMAQAMGEGGRIVTLELDPQHAEIARRNLKRAGVSERVEVRVGDALALLPKLVAKKEGPFDLIFIDGDKKSYPKYLEYALALAHAGTVIVADNVVRDGEVANAKSRDGNVQGVRKMLEQIAAEPRLSATALQTVCGKGYDGFVMAVVL
ncbi:MAG: O-methyltransferase [Acidobacteriota bacterium]|nr:O-methyltransferase [Acidobacteriota bacterium]